MIVDLATIAELALALIGFSALIAVFRGGSIQAWEPRRRLALWVIVTYGLAALYFALLPTVFRALRVSSWGAAMGRRSDYVARHEDEGASLFGASRGRQRTQDCRASWA